MTVDPLIATMLERDDALRYRAKTADMLAYFERRALESPDARLLEHYHALANCFTGLLSRYEELLATIEDRIDQLDRARKGR